MTTNDAARFFYPNPMPQPSLLDQIGIQAEQNLAETIKIGLPFQAFKHLQEQLELSQAELGQLVTISTTTLKRRQQQDRFTPLEGDRLLRIAMVLERSVTLFENNHEQALRWLKSAARALGGITPLTHLATEAGAREVLDLIGCLEHGVTI